jgi:hypothetical protein
VLAVVATIITAAGAADFVLTRQLIDLVTKLPDYKVNLQTKLRSFQTSKGGSRAAEPGFMNRRFCRVPDGPVR